jgi:2-polyprenyl-6-methoxyphenol hydroxylase-like FAD-dependent oxidoreductase
MRAIVIGSGIAGLCCALGLRKVGVEVTLYERALELREVGAGIMLWANGLRALQALGALDAVRAVSMPLTHMQIAAKNGYRVQVTAEADEMERQIGFAPAVCLTHRAELVGSLASLLPEGMAHYGHECIGVKTRGDRVGVEFANGHRDEADILIGADGLRSCVGKELFGLSEPRYAGYMCWRGVCPRPASFSAGEGRLWSGAGAQVGFCSLVGDRVYWFATQNASPGQRADDEHAAVTQAFKDWASPFPELIASTAPDRVIRADIIDRPPTRPWVKGRFALIGDAAHPMTPNFGQGGGMAIEDAVVLARSLTKTPSAPEAALAAFEAERFPRTSLITNEAWRFGKVLQLEGPLSVWARDLLSGIMIRLTGTNNLIKHARFDVGQLAGRGAPE